LNKVIYIGNENLMEKTRNIQEFSVEEREEEIRSDLVELKSDWIILKKEIEEILNRDER
jgi:hypothetical protein